VKLPWLRPSAVTAFQVSTRAGVAAALSLFFARRLNLPFPVYALIAAIIVTDLSPATTRRLALQRLVGTFLGAIFGAVVTVATPASQTAAPTVALAVVGTMLLSHLIGIPAAARLAGYVCAIVLVSFSDQPWTYAAYRCVETILGIATAVGVSFVPKLIRVDESPEFASRPIETKK
jgi:uncharacterized membrane protein YgaE (UPF0421/DUF939 family)